MGTFQTIINWLRGGYPEGVPQEDYVALLGVLHRSLTPVEVDKIVRLLASELNGVDPDEAVERVRKAVAEQTLQTPSEEDVARVLQRLEGGGWPLRDTSTSEPDNG